MKCEIIQPSGCCFGVKHAIEVCEELRIKNPHTPIYVLGMLVHNETVIEHLNALNIKTMTGPIENNINAISSGIVVFTAHGHDEKYEKMALDKGLSVIDTTCTFVKLNHKLIKDGLKEKHQIIFIGKRNHPEAEACLSISSNVLLYDSKENFDFTKVSDISPIIISQTTMSIIEVKKIYELILDKLPAAKLAKSVCHATMERQNALKNINENCDLIIVVGSPTSSNTTKLFEIAELLYQNKDIKQIKTVNDLINCSLEKYKYVSLIGGASTPIQVLETIKDYIINL